MSRRRAGLTPSLFPFLAVLVCTLGTLILLLALVAGEARQAAVKQVDQERSQRARSAASTEQPTPAGVPTSSRRLTADAAERLLEQEQFRLQELVAHREKQTGELERRRDQLTHLERQRRQLLEELQRLRAEVDRATSEQPIAEVDRQTLVLLKTEIEKLETEVAELKESVTEGRPRVVLVPHKGPNGTDRRPIYVECTEQGVTIWPEGVRLTVDQLIAAAESPRPTGNALDAALRAVRGHALQYYGDAAPPYPLLVVRPDGILTYKIAVSAMDDWDDQYGYELVPAEVDLAFPEPDSKLRDRMELAVHEASVRAPRVRIAGSAGRGRSGGSRRGAARQTAGNGGSIRPLSDQATFEPMSGFGPGEKGGDPTAADGAAPNRLGGTPGSGANERPPANQPRERRVLPTLSARDLDLQAQAGGFRPPRDSRAASLSPYGSAVPGSTGGGYGAAPQPVQSQSESLNKWLNATHANVESPAAGPSDSETSEPAPSSLADRMAGAVRSPGSDGTEVGRGSGTAEAGSGEQPAGSIPPTDSVESAADSANGTSMPATTPTDVTAAGSSGYRPSGSPNPSDVDPESSPPQSDPASMSGQPAPPAGQPPVRRVGKDWALPASLAGMRGTEVIRPIQMVCYTDRFELIDQGRVVQQFRFDEWGLERATMELATAVRDRVSQWGATLPGGRWQPRLDVLVAPHADRRYHELRTLMQNSGVEVTRRLR